MRPAFSSWQRHLHSRGGLQSCRPQSPSMSIVTSIQKSARCELCSKWQLQCPNKQHGMPSHSSLSRFLFCSPGCSKAVDWCCDRTLGGRPEGKWNCFPGLPHAKLNQHPKSKQIPIFRKQCITFPSQFVWYACLDYTLSSPQSNECKQVCRSRKPSQQCKYLSVHNVMSGIHCLECNKSPVLAYLTWLGGAWFQFAMHWIHQAVVGRAPPWSSLLLLHLRVTWYIQVLKFRSCCDVVISDITLP